jgi:hypothetical protein
VTVPDIWFLNHLIILPEGRYYSKEDEGILSDYKTKYEIFLSNSPNLCKLSIKYRMLAMGFISVCYMILPVMACMTGEAMI